MAVGRLTKRHAANGAEFAIVVADCCQRAGLGTELLRRMVQIGRDEGLDWICAEMLTDNVGMQHTAEKVGFTLREIPGRGLVRAELDLRA